MAKQEGPVRWGDPSTDAAEQIGPGEADRSIYTDPARLAREEQQIFRNSWLIAERVEAIPHPGDFLVWERCGQSVVIARQSDASIRAFHNVCRHRGARIAKEGGHCKTGRLRCPFHGFTYDLAGELVGVPERASFAPAQLDGLRAQQVGVALRDGFIWLHFTPETAPTLDEYLAPVSDEISWYGFDAWKYYGGNTYVAEANWKVVLEGFLETWHTPVAHEKTIRGGYEPLRTSFATLGPHSMMVTPITALDIDAAPKPIEHRAIANCHYLLFPNAFWNLSPGQGNLITVYPDGIGRTVCQGFILASRTPPEGVAYEDFDRGVATSVKLMDRIMAEDLGIAGEIGATRRSFADQRLIYSKLECRITAFHEELDRRLASD